MEIHRLKQVPENYDRELFNRLYEATRSLRKSLTYQVDARRFGVSSDIIASWFDDKFTYVFFKYYGKKEPEMLKGYLINSLKTFKFRMLRKAYQESYIELYNNIVHLEDQEKELSNIPDEPGVSAQEALLEMAMDYLKSKLAPEAYTILEVTINPPLYIISRMKDPSVRIPTKLLLQFLDISPTEDMVSKVNKIRRHIDEVIASAKYHFKDCNLEVA